jgi:hypothetical protein
MNERFRGEGAPRHASRRREPHALAAIAAAMLASGSATAFQIDSGNPDVVMSWDNTVKYSNAFRGAQP